MAMSSLTYIFSQFIPFREFFVLIANIIPNYSKGNYYVMGSQGPSLPGLV
jgi:hypothetical protein